MSEIEVVRQMLAQMNSAFGENPTVEELRAGYQQMGGTAPMAPDVSVEEIGLGGVSGLRLTPPTAESQRTILYFHGGGYVIGGSDSHKAMVSHIAAAACATAWVMDYRLAPEAPFPAAVDDGVAAYKALLETGVASDNIIIAGDSAGGGLSVATALKLVEGGTPLPAGLVLLSPWVDLEGKGWSNTALVEADPMVTPHGLADMASHYAGSEAKSHPLISPIHADLKGLPPMFIQVGQDEILLSDSTTLAERAGAAGVAVTLQIWPEMVHVFQFLHHLLGDARIAIEDIADWVTLKTAE